MSFHAKMDYAPARFHKSERRLAASGEPFAYTPENQAAFDRLVTHYPPGASKWNPIEHRMFSLISIHWAAEPLSSYEVILMLIRGTKSSTGFRCLACLDEEEYPTEAKVSKAQRATIRLERRPFLPRLNYAILPHDPPD